MSQIARNRVSSRLVRYAVPALLAAIALLSGCATPTAMPTPRSTAAEDAPTVPAPLLDESAGQARSEVTVLAGGCFWGVQGVFQHVTGVTQAVSGYDGGTQATAEYETVSSGTTGHAESVQITFDPQQISYGRLLQIYFSVAHDPTQLNRQGPDSGTQYRSAIFPATADQARVAKAYIDQLQQVAVFKSPIVTHIEPDQTFYPAEAYHQDYLTRNPGSPYIMINDLPKIDNLKRIEPDVYRADPVLVAMAPVK
jgi:peptide-methionine (S)-S-oxide reductase